MALEVPQRIHERLVAAIEDLRNAVGQEAAKAFLVSLTNVEPVELARSPHIATTLSPNTSTALGPCEHFRESEAPQKRGESENNILEAVVQGLPRSDLLDCFETRWQALTIEGIYAMPSH